jgi:hypothetical protein
MEGVAPAIGSQLKIWDFPPVAPLGLCFFNLVVCEFIVDVMLRYNAHISCCAANFKNHTVWHFNTYCSVLIEPILLFLHNLVQSPLDM